MRPFSITPLFRGGQRWSYLFDERARVLIKRIVHHSPRVGLRAEPPQKLGPQRRGVANEDAERATSLAVKVGQRGERQALITHVRVVPAHVKCARDVKAPGRQHLAERVRRHTDIWWLSILGGCALVRGRKKAEKKGRAHRGGEKGSLCLAAAGHHPGGY